MVEDEGITLALDVMLSFSRRGTHGILYRKEIICVWSKVKTDTAIYIRVEQNFHCLINRAHNNKMKPDTTPSHPASGQ